METQTPYRQIEDIPRLTLDDEERGAIAGASTWMVRAGIVGMVAALLRSSELVGFFSWMTVIYAAAGVAFAAVVLIAGRQLSSIRHIAPGQDYQAVARSLRWLAIVFRIKGIAMLTVIALLGALMLLPLLVGL